MTRDGRDYEIVCGDNATVLPDVPPGSIDLVVTSPPYFGQREYATQGVGNEDTIDQYLQNILDTLALLLPAMRPHGNIIYNLGDKILQGSLQLIPHRFALLVIGQLGLRLVNNITWLKLNPTPNQSSRRLTSSTEPLFHFALGDRYHHDRDAFQQDLSPGRGRSLRHAGLHYRPLIERSSLTQEERRRAHLALDQAVADLRAGRIRDFRMKLRGIHAPAFRGQEGGRTTHLEQDGFVVIQIHGHPLKRDIIETPVESIPGIDHPAVYPVQLAREAIRLLCPPAGRVLDPYLGSGSTMVAAAQESRGCLGIDISPRYCRDAWQRFLDEANQPRLL